MRPILPQNGTFFHVPWLPNRNFRKTQPVLWYKKYFKRVTNALDYYFFFSTLLVRWTCIFFSFGRPLVLATSWAVLWIEKEFRNEQKRSRFIDKVQSSSLFPVISTVYCTDYFFRMHFCRAFFSTPADIAWHASQLPFKFSNLFKRQLSWQTRQSTCPFFS